MALMLAKTYAAFKAANVPEAEAQAAAEELAGYENRLASIDNKLAGIEGRLTVMLWAVGINAAATFGMLWQLVTTIAQLSAVVGRIK